MKKFLITSISILILTGSSNAFASDLNRNSLTNFIDNVIQFFVTTSLNDKVDTDQISQNKFIQPLNGDIKITLGFHQGHPAVDMEGTDSNLSKAIIAVSSGQVMQAELGWNGGYGNVIVIDHGDNIQTRYAHLKTIEVQKGQNVSQGQEIGIMGNSGRVYGKDGVHLHFEVIVKKVRQNPLKFF